MTLDDPEIEVQLCWYGDEEYGACNMPAENGVGLCDTHLELLRKGGK